jgi:pyruvate, water dikinase
VRVIDVPGYTGGRILRVLLNADLDRAVAVLAEPDQALPEQDGAAARAEAAAAAPGAPLVLAPAHGREDRQRAGRRGPRRGRHVRVRFGQERERRTGQRHRPADPRAAEPRQRAELLAWLDGWSRCLAEMNYLETGIRSDGLLDVHLVTDEDIARRTSWAAKINAVTDAARPLPLGHAAQA